MFLTPTATINFVTRDGRPRSSQIQGQDAIIVEATADHLWSLISHSMELCNWGPPIRGVTILSDDGVEGYGTWRRVDAEFDGKQGHFIERRIEHLEGRKVTILIEEETFGVFRLLSEVRSSLEIEPLDLQRTKVIFTFFHDTKGPLGSVMNTLVIRRQQSRNRLAALASLKNTRNKPLPQGTANTSYTSRMAGFICVAEAKFRPNNPACSFIEMRP